MAEQMKMSRRTMVASVALAGALAPLVQATPSHAQKAAVAVSPVDIASLPRVKVELAKPPFVHAHTQKAEGGPKVVEFTMTIEEKKIILDAKGTEVHAMTFNGSVPGPLMVVHQDDYVELTLINPATNSMPHNIDFHSATGALGGAGLTLVSPGEKVILRFKATKAGVFVYHCAPPGMVPWHVVSGMNGAIMVLPRGGLTDENGKPLKFDRAYYVAEQDYYLRKDDEGKYKEYDTPSAGFADMIPVMRSLTPSHLVLNGVESALLGDRAMLAEVGEKVLFITSSCNIDARFHIIGGHADLVWQGGSFNDRPITDQETWMVPGGSAVAALYQFREPGTYAFVDHNLIKADIFQAAGEVKVSGDWDNSLMEQVEPPHAIQ